MSPCSPLPGNTRRSVPEARRVGLEFAQSVHDAGKPLVAFFFSDSAEAVPFPATVLRTSFTRSARRPGEFALPAWNEDLVERHFNGQLPVRRRPERPIVGFCGRVPLWSRLRDTLARWRGHGIGGGDALRVTALGALSRARTVTPSIVRRNEFFGSATFDASPSALIQRDRLRHEYLMNLIGSDYALCIRGVGNYSFRLYEALCCGRIPVIVDSDCVLPYDWEIDWRSVGVWIRPEALDTIGERIAAFHAKLSDDAFVELQHEYRRLWVERLSPEGFFRHFHEHFTARAD